jgi:hypothetical protein
MCIDKQSAAALLQMVTLARLLTACLHLLLQAGATAAAAAQVGWSPPWLQ